MEKEEAKKIIEEFEKAHSKYSASVAGNWERSWKKKLVHADLIKGYWYWKGHRLADLHKLLDHS